MSELKYQLMLNKDMSWVPCYLKSEADNVIAELEESHKMEVEQILIEIDELKKKLAAAQQVLRLNKPEALFSNLETMGRLNHEKYVVEMEAAEQKAKAEKLHSCLKCLVMRDLIKDCPEKLSAIDLMEKLK